MFPRVCNRSTILISAVLASTIFPSTVFADRVMGLFAGNGLNPGDLIVSDANASGERILRIDPSTGTVTQIPFPAAGVGSIDGNVSGLAIYNGLSTDPLTGRIYAANQVATGNTNGNSIVQGDWNGVSVASSNLTSGGNLSWPRDIAFDNSGNLIAIDRGTAGGNAALVSINANTGVQTVLTTITPAANDPATVAVDKNTGNIYVGLNGSIVRWNGVTQTTIATSGDGRGTGDAATIGFVLGLSFDPQGRLVVAEQDGSLYRIDLSILAGVNRTSIASGGGNNFNDVVVSKSGDIFVARNSAGNQQILRYDPVTFTSSVIATGGLLSLTGTALNGIALYEPTIVTLTPEPGACVLFGCALAFVAGFTWWRKRRLAI